MKKIIFLFTVAALFLTACGNDNNSTTSAQKLHGEEAHEHGDHEHADADADHDHSTHEHATATESRSIEASNVKNSATAGIIDAYIDIKNGLANDNKSDAATGGKALLAAFSEFDMTKLSGEQHKEYMEIMEDAKEQAEHIIKSPIDHQREHFEVLSTDVNDLIALLGTDKTLYQDFCPMVNDGKGAIWISEIKEIKNPFMGSKMPKCGEIKKQIN